MEREVIAKRKACIMDSNYKPFYEYLKQLGLADQIIFEILSCFAIRKYKKGQYFAAIDEVSDRIGFIIYGLF